MSTQKRLPELVVRNEAEAYALLEKALNGKVEPWSALRLEGWPHLTIYLKGEKFEQTITPTVMKSLLEYQRLVYRAYASAKYDNESKRLTDAEKEALEIRVKVEGGSTKLDLDVNALAIEFVKQMGAKMDSTHILIVLLTFLALYFGTSSLKTFLDNRREVRLKELTDDTQRQTLEVLKFSSAQETKRTELLTQAISELPSKLKAVEELSQDAKVELVKAVSEADTAKIGSVPMDGRTAMTLVQNARRTSDEVRLDGRYRLLKLDWSDASRFRVKVYNIVTGVELDAEVQDDTLTGNYRKLLQDAEWSRSPVLLQINARQVGQEFRGAVILKVEPDSSPTSRRN
ncbi:hypothetical protein PV762_01515 [Mitsuaria sp. CC2]|uniref:hypothetical protein n=1 Tax=Mitsuaria sp. CC2 TaxID=3029186 RepID=UPI003B8D401F